MSPVVHWVRMWRTLDAHERRVRGRRVLERLLRRRAWTRALRVLPDQPRWRELRGELRRDLDAVVDRLRATDRSRGPLHVQLEQRAERIARRHPRHADRILAQARALLEREFDLLGSGPARPLRKDGGIDWHRDWKSGRAWSPRTYYGDLRLVRGDGSDVKLPWELSRCQHLTVLGQAWWLARHRLGIAEADELRRRLAGETVRQIDDWIAHNPRALGVNWSCAMDVALRVVSWSVAFGMLREAPELDDAFVRRLVRAVWLHGTHIRANLERGQDGLTSNHYLSNVVGLLAASCLLPELHDAAAWRDFARGALSEELERQVHADGANFERSIPYHRLVTELFLLGALLLEGQGWSPGGTFRRRLALMLEFTAAYTRPDGTAPQWGDNDDGRALPLLGYASAAPHDHRHLLGIGGAWLGRADLWIRAGERTVEAEWLCEELPEAQVAGPEPPASVAFPEVGYYVMGADDLHAGISCGGVGTRGVGNHTHNDVGSICVWASGREWITDPGTGCYSADPELRNRLRSTAAHATLQLGAREQNSLGSGLEGLFVMTERAHPEVLEWRTGARSARLCVRHHGYSRGAERWSCTREIDFRAEARTWTVLDVLELAQGGWPRASDEPVFLRYPLLPGTLCHKRTQPAEWPEALRRAVVADERVRVFELTADRAGRFWIALRTPRDSITEVREGVYSPRYGVYQPGPVLVATLPLAPRVETTSLLYAPRPEERR